MTQQAVYWFAIVERGTADQPHVHALLAGTAALRLDQLRRWWRLGNTSAERYEPAEAAGYYIVKELPRMMRDDDDNYRFRFRP
jgi:hypothetical protein